MYKVMIVEDEMFVRLGIKNSVEWGKFSMEVVSDVANGEIAYREYQEKKPNLIITDLKMPIMDGMELIKKIRETDKDTRIVIISSLEEFNSVKDAISYGVSDYMLKLGVTTAEMENLLSKIKNEIELIKSSKYKRIGGAEQQLIETQILNYITGHEGEYDIAQSTSLPFKHNNFIMAIVQIDNYKKLQQSSAGTHGDSIFGVFKNISTEAMGNYGECLTICESINKYIIIADIDMKKTSLSLEEIFIKYLNAVRSQAIKSFGSTITCTISRNYSNIEHLVNMYKECELAQDHLFYCGTNQNLLYRHLKSKDTRNFRNNIINKTIEKLNKLPQGSHIVAQLKEITEAQADKSIIINFFNMLINKEVESLMLDKSITYSIIDKYYHAIADCVTLEQIADVYIECTKEILDQVSQNQSLSRTVLKIIKYIKNNYKNDISLNQIAETVELSSNYTCSIFKREMGITITNYLMHFRINKAKELIKNTNMRFNEIGREVGIIEESYFSRCFKKITGMSPKNYKMQLKDS